MTDLFSPRRADGRAEWRVIYDHAVGLPYGSSLTFEQIASMLGTDDRDRAYRAVARCNRQFTHENKPRVLGGVRGMGYRVLQPSEYTPMAMGYQKRARRSLTTAVDIMRAAPLEDMNPSQREWHHKIAMVLMDNEMRLKSQEQWQKEAEARLEELEQRMGLRPKVIPGSTG